MKKRNSLFLAVISAVCAVMLSICAVPLSVFATETADTSEGAGEENVPESSVYVKDGGEGDGTSADSPLSDISAAFSALSEHGGRIVVIGAYDLASSSLHDDIWGAVVEPEHDSKITISGMDATVPVTSRNA